MSIEDSPLSLEELARFPADPPNNYLCVEAQSPVTGYGYELGFRRVGPRTPYAQLDTEPRASFLEKGTEQQAQDAMIELGQELRRSSGGSFAIHAFQGAVHGTRLTPVAPGHFTDLEDPEERLSLSIYLTDVADKFDGGSTDEALAIGKSVSVPGISVGRLLAYTSAPRANPNQESRDTAIINGLGVRWYEEFRRLNQPEDVPQAMEITPFNVAALVKELINDGLLHNLVVKLPRRQS